MFLSNRSDITPDFLDLGGFFQGISLTDERGIRLFQLLFDKSSKNYVKTDIIMRKNNIKIAYKKVFVNKVTKVDKDT
ncbi:hypothetical protein BpHYR1_033323, partial [Brachionus plicatilis]